MPEIQRHLSDSMIFYTIPIAAQQRFLAGAGEDGVGRENEFSNEAAAGTGGAVRRIETTTVWEEVESHARREGRGWRASGGGPPQNWHRQKKQARL
jgi:hypothetical protein